MIKVSIDYDGYNNRIHLIKPNEMESFDFSDSIENVFDDEIFSSKKEMNESTFSFPGIVAHDGNKFFEAMLRLLSVAGAEDYIFENAVALEEKYREYTNSISRMESEFANLKRMDEIDPQKYFSSKYLSKYFVPYDFQIEHSSFALRNKKSSNFSSPGSGKTITASIAIANLFDKQVRDFLVIGPKSARLAWMNEPKGVINNDFLDYRYKSEGTDLSIDFKKGVNVLEEAKENSKIRIWFINLNKLDDKIKANTIFKNFSRRKYGVIVDEAHYFKNHFSTKHKNMNSLLTNSSFTLLLTGSPFPKDKIQGAYIPKMLFPGINTGIDFEKMEVDDIRPKLEYLYVKKDKNKVEGIKPMKNDFVSFKENEIEKYMMNEFNRLTDNYLDKKSFDKWGKAIVIRLMQATSSPKSLLNPLNDSISEIESEIQKDELEFINENRSPDIKLDSVMQEIIRGSKVKNMIDNYKMSEDDRYIETAKIIDKNSTERILIWNVFRKSSEMLKDELSKKYPNKKVFLIDGNIVNLEREKILSSFKKNKGSILIASPATIAESVSLHNEVNIAIYYFRNYVGSHWMQSRDRIHRLVKPGCETFNKFSYILNCDDESSIDKSINENLSEKTKLQADLID